VTPLKRLLQAFWGLGALGYAYLHVADGAAADMSPLDVILAEPWTIWLVGPIGAAITGVTFKEGMCYGKRECYVLTFMVPALFLVHLFGVDQAAPWVGWALDIAVCALGAVFAGRKYIQRLEDDIDMEREIHHLGEIQEWPIGEREGGHRSTEPIGPTNPHSGCPM
jgi:uncharacterized integral membrane protein